ncbi:c-type cytochrome biogenesis protein CcmI [Primorskyibacter marinus]|uniref:c-type cytochrome biogenesis protein CcmI n=1 Tax=Primorskyibacter marinus TaxID=1977320 RepID=UPI000E304041|nr:c-type cytochrome biogenesis protein CcmI [Primorskyibacter marinus]
MTVFWFLTVALTCGVAALLTLALVRGRRDTGPAEAFDLKVYRDQLAEIDRDAARSVIAPEDAERLRTEVSRRILAADSRVQEGKDVSQVRRGGMVFPAVLTLALLAGGIGLYWQLGAPGYGDLGLERRKEMARDARENRPSQAEAEAEIARAGPAPLLEEPPAEYLALVTRLRGAVEERPDDLQGQTLLAGSEAALGNYVAASEAQAQVVSLRGEGATARDYADLADMRILAAGGYVSPAAEDALNAALSRDPANGVARYYYGLMMAQTGRPDAAFRLWQDLLRDSTATDPWIVPLRAQIEDMAMRAGVDYQLPPLVDAPGPSAADIDAAGEMSEADRQEMIRGMVARLSNRLAIEGGPPEDWARLIGAHNVLGDTAQARAILQNAEEVFVGNAAALETIRAAARSAGLLP